MAMGMGSEKQERPALWKMGMNSMNQTSGDLASFFWSFFLQNGLGPDIVPLCLYGDGASHRSKRFCNGGPIGGFFWTQFAMNFQRRTDFLGPKSWFFSAFLAEEMRKQQQELQQFAKASDFFLGRRLPKW